MYEIFKERYAPWNDVKKFSQLLISGSHKFLIFGDLIVQFHMKTFAKHVVCTSIFVKQNFSLQVVMETVSIENAP